MRYLWSVIVVAAGCLLAPAGVGHTDPGPPGTMLSADSHSILVGSPEAPRRLEIFCEPQCPHCAQFETASGEALARRLDSGELSVTYRWVTFLDAKRNNDVSARIANALVLAADPTTSAASYQGFVTELYRRQDAHAPAPTATDLATMAAQNGVAGWAIARIAIDLPVVDTAAMSADNMARLKQVNPKDPGTPTVYNLNTDRVVSTQDAGWLASLFTS